jgi:predicted nucleic acid-binding protein
MNKIALDTNILVYFFEGIEPHATKVENLLNSFTRGENKGIISTISVAEVMTGFYIARSEKKGEIVKNHLHDLEKTELEIVPVTFGIADLAAVLRAKRGGKLSDCLIVATAIDRKADLLYSQDEDLERFNKDVKLMELQ